LAAAVEASGIPDVVFLAIIDQQLASDEVSLDDGLGFVAPDYLMLNLGAFLLLFAIGGISFLASCVFNLSKNSLIFGAGIPVAFFIFKIMGEVSTSLENFKYVSLNTLFDPASVTGGGSYWVQYVVLAAVGVVMYAVGVKAFEKKDLPL
jgi:ABC-2 type transport system permease protein